MDESREIRSMRNMAWQRAIGELYAMKQTYWDNSNFDEFDKLLDKFILDVEDKGLQE